MHAIGADTAPHQGTYLPQGAPEPLAALFNMTSEAFMLSFPP